MNASDSEHSDRRTASPIMTRMLTNGIRRETLHDCCGRKVWNRAAAVAREQEEPAHEEEVVAEVDEDVRHLGSGGPNSTVVGGLVRVGLEEFLLRPPPEHPAHRDRREQSEARTVRSPSSTALPRPR